MGFWQTPTRLVPSFSREGDDGLLPPSLCGSAFLQEVFTLLQADESWSIPGPRTVGGVARWLAHLLGQGGHKSGHLSPSKVNCWSTSQEDRSPPEVCLGGVRTKTYFLDSRLSSSLEDGERPLCLEVVYSMWGTDLSCLGEVLFNTGRKKELSNCYFLALFPLEYPPNLSFALLLFFFSSGWGLVLIAGFPL